MFANSRNDAVNDHPLISIIITTYNRSSLLDECIRSALNQEYSSVEIIVVDDGSIDDTHQVAESHKDHIRYIHKDHSGIAASRNAGCENASGDYIAFVDDDDLMHPKRLDRLLQAILRNPGAVCAFCQGGVIDEDGYETGEMFFNDRTWPKQITLLQDAYDRMVTADLTITPLNSLFQKAAGERANGFDEAFVHGCEDTDFFMRLSKEGPFVCVPENLTWVREGQRESLARNELKMDFSKVQLLDKHIAVNKKNGKTALVRLLRQRKYHFIKRLVGNRFVSLGLFEEHHGVNLFRSFLGFTPKQVMYLLYLRYLKS